MRLTRRLATLVAASAVAAALVHAQAGRPSDLFDSRQLLQDLKTLSADEMEGRLVGTPGGEKARAFVVRRFKESGVQPIGDTLLQPFTFTGGRGGAQSERKGVNVIGRIDGKDATRFIVLTAHYDHIGVRENQVFNGADDNASGTAALFAIAKYFSAHRPANAILVAALDGEESGLRGARAMLNAPPVPIASMVVNVNIDMIGRAPDDKLYAAGAHAYPFLKPYLERVAASAPVKLLLGHDDPQRRDVEDWTRDSDHYVFHQAKIPFVYLGVEDFDQHHKATDDYDTISHDFYVRAVETAIRVIQEFDANLEAIRRHEGREGDEGHEGKGDGDRQKETAMKAMRPRSLLALVVTGLFLAAPVGSQTPASQRLELTTAHGTLTATLAVPPRAGRFPVVVLLPAGAADARAATAEALAAQSIASLTPELASDADPNGHAVAAWITRLRNDSRFDRIMVVSGEGPSAGALRASRAARADGVFLVGGAETGRASLTEWGRPSIPVTVEAAPDYVPKLVQFVRTTSLPRHPEGERRSPREVVMAEIGGSQISVEHGRPSKRGRVIWGTLVPYGRWWMPGADEATSFTTTRPLTFGDLNVPAGDYTLYTQPDDTTFMLIINSETGQFHTTYHSDRDLGRVEMQKAAASSPAEMLTFGIDTREGGGALKLTWDDREYVAPFVVVQR